MIHLIIWKIHKISYREKQRELARRSFSNQHMSGAKSSWQLPKDEKETKSDMIEAFFLYEKKASLLVLKDWKYCE